MPQQNDPTRTASTQPYRTTSAAQLTARRIQIYEADGRTTTAYPLETILSQRTRATLAALKGGRTNGR